MLVLRAADYRRMPWKNGAGVTTEIAIHPENAGLDAFEWRLSMALVAQDGPFSLFPGVDRVLAVLEGEGLALSIDGAPPEVLTPVSRPLAFSADLPVLGVLAGGPVKDLNLMVRRGTRHSMRRVGLDMRAKLSLGARWNLIFNPANQINVEAGHSRVALGPLDTLVVEGEMEVQVAAKRLGWILVIEVG